MPESEISLLVPRSLVKTVKTALQQQQQQQSGGQRQRCQILPVGVGGGGGGGNKSESNGDTDADADADADAVYTIRTTLPAHTDAAGLLAALPAGIRLLPVCGAHPPAPTPTPAHNPLTSAIASFLHLHTHLPASSIPLHLSTAPKRWSHYPPLLLLPASAFTTPPWPHTLSTTLTPAQRSAFYSALAHALNCTHLARNAPIAPTSLLRSPRLVPLHGDLAGLWAHTTQHGIRQTWLVAHTMFSRGNVREKARVLGLSGVRGGAVADLFAGIGYFAFSYVKAGAAVVWCWELNPCSVEALRRGAGYNGWRCLVVGEGEVFPEGPLKEGTRLVVFCEDNKYAAGRLRGRGVKVAHVNLGLLPTSRGAWETAREVVEEGGVVHVHENVKEGQQGAVEREVLGVFEGAVVEHVERVKTFAPGVVHCVFDVRVK